MPIAPIPRQGTVLVGRDAVGRSLRVSRHPDAGRVVLSIWQDGVCRATVRLALDDLPDLVAGLGAVPVDGLGAGSVDGLVEGLGGGADLTVADATPVAG